MGKILEAFAEDKLLLASRFFKDTSVYGRAVEQLCKIEEGFLASLHAPEKKLLDKLSDTQEIIASLSATDRFVHGYRLGVLMTIEIFNGSDELITGKESA